MATAKQKALPSLEKLATLGTRLLAIRDERRDLGKANSKLTAEADEIEATMINVLTEAKLTTYGTVEYNISVVPSTVASVKDWDAFYKFLAKTKFFHLLQRRISDPSWRELMEQRKGKNVPGVEPFEKKSISLTKRK